MIVPEFHIIIPARYASTRLPGKALLLLGQQTMIERVYRQALKTRAKSITVATDHPLIAEIMSDLGAAVIMTEATHTSGTDRVAQAADLLGLRDQEIIVNVQGDEPFIPPELIHQVATNLSASQTQMATLCWPIHDHAEFMNPNVVKVVRDSDNCALYFSRSAIPAHRDHGIILKNAWRHIGLYAYRAGFLQRSVLLPQCELESIEMLEQLRILFSGQRILVEQACIAPQQDINTADDLDRVLNQMQRQECAYD